MSGRRVTFIGRIPLFLRRMEALDRARDERLARIDEENRRRREAERRERDPWWQDQ